MIFTEAARYSTNAFTQKRNDEVSSLFALYLKGMVHSYLSFLFTVDVFEQNKMEKDL